MNREEFKRLFPRASEATIRDNELCGVIREAGAPRPSEIAVAELRAREAAAAGQRKGNTRRLRQQQVDKRNPTEIAFAAHVRGLYPNDRVYEQQLTFVLANGLRYTPDVVVFSNQEYPSKGSRGVIAYEVKGFMREDAAVKLKMAAVAFPDIDWYLVTKKKKCDGEGWWIEQVFPLHPSARNPIQP